MVGTVIINVTSNRDCNRIHPHKIANKYGDSRLFHLVECDMKEARGHRAPPDAERLSQVMFQHNRMCTYGCQHQRTKKRDRADEKA